LQKGLKKIAVIPLYIIGFLFMGLLSGFLTFKILSFSKTVDVPDLKGRTLIEANVLLTKKGLYLKAEGEEYDPVVLPGRIVRQDVPPGNKVKERRGIKVIVSKGPRVSSVPEVIGLGTDEAELVISQSGLRVTRVIRVHSTKVIKDRVIAQWPAPDEPMRETMTLVVSSGPYNIIYYCPDFSGKDRNEAQTLAERLGLDAEFTGQGERVISQKPKPDTPVKPGDGIHLFLGE
jgi:eukaryotic-like serine/threonine-protein kinase